MKRTALRRVSPKKAVWNARYRTALAAAKQAQVDDNGVTFCERCRMNGPVDGHHPDGQLGCKIMDFRLVCRTCHSFFHAHGATARAEGWLR